MALAKLEAIERGVIAADAPTIAEVVAGVQGSVVQMGRLHVAGNESGDEESNKKSGGLGAAFGPSIAGRLGPALPKSFTPSSNQAQRRPGGGGAGHVETFSSTSVSVGKGHPSGVHSPNTASTHHALTRACSCCLPCACSYHSCRLRFIDWALYLAFRAVRVVAWLRGQWTLWVTVAVVVLAYAVPVMTASELLVSVSVATVFFLNGLSLPLAELLQVPMHIKAFAYVAVHAFVISPTIAIFCCYGIPLSASVARGWLLSGLLCVSVLPPPTLLAVMSTSAAGGSDTFAMCLSAAGNLFGAIASPLILQLVLLIVEATGLDGGGSIGGHARRTATTSDADDPHSEQLLGGHSFAPFLIHITFVVLLPLLVGLFVQYWLTLRSGGGSAHQTYSSLHTFCTPSIGEGGSSASASNNGNEQQLTWGPATGLGGGIVVGAGPPHTHSVGRGVFSVDIASKAEPESRSSGPAHTPQQQGVIGSPLSDLSAQGQIDSSSHTYLPLSSRMPSLPPTNLSRHPSQEHYLLTAPSRVVMRKVIFAITMLINYSMFSALFREDHASYYLNSSHSDSAVVAAEGSGRLSGNHYLKIVLDDKVIAAELHEELLFDGRLEEDLRTLSGLRVQSAVERAADKGIVLHTTDERTGTTNSRPSGIAGGSTHLGTQESEEDSKLSHASIARGLPEEAIFLHSNAATRSMKKNTKNFEGVKITVAQKIDWYGVVYVTGLLMLMHALLCLSAWFFTGSPFAASPDTAVDSSNFTVVTNNTKEFEIETRRDNVSGVRRRNPPISLTSFLQNVVRSPEDRIAVFFNCCQKSDILAITFVSIAFASSSSAASSHNTHNAANIAIMLIPALIYHLIQSSVGAVLAFPLSRWRNQQHCRPGTTLLPTRSRRALESMSIFRDGDGIGDRLGGGGGVGQQHAEGEGVTGGEHVAFEGHHGSTRSEASVSGAVSIATTPTSSRWSPHNYNYNSQGNHNYYNYNTAVTASYNNTATVNSDRGQWGASPAPLRSYAPLDLPVSVATEGPLSPNPMPPANR